MKNILIILLILIGSSKIIAQKHIKNYVFFNMDREKIKDSTFLQSDNIVGAQLKYSWKELEPIKDHYNFSQIKKDLKFLNNHNKKLFIQLQDVTFDTIRVFVPKYIFTESKYNGGANIQYITDNDDKIVRQDGYMSRRWDKNVAERFHKLIASLAKEFDGKIEGINFSETAVGFGDTGKHFPKGFTPEIYRDAILQQMKAAKQAFSKSTVIQYANYMPGEWLPWDNKKYLESLYQLAAKENIGMGGPDIKIYKKAQMNHSYKFLKEFSDNIVTGIAVQDGNYEEINPKTGKQVTIDEIYKFGKEEIGLDYIFWCTQEPYYSKFLIPYLAKIKHN